MDLLEAVERRRSIRKFKPEPISDDDLKKILEAARLAPSGGNQQPWFFIVVKDPETKQALATASNKQKFIADAAAIVVAIGDPGIVSKATASATGIMYKQDPMIAVEHMVLASTALGYGTCWIGAFSEKEVRKIAKVPKNLAVIALLPIGVPDESPDASPDARPGKPFNELFFKEEYGAPLEM